ncbi:MAG: 6-phosphofructokinase [bacterium]
MRINLYKTPLPRDNGEKWIMTAHGGGPAPGSCAAVKGIVDAAAQHPKVNVVGFIDGFEGMMSGEAIILGRNLLDGVELDGGVFLGTARRNPTENERGELVAQLRKWGLTGGIIIGGDDSNTSGARMNLAGFPMNGVPKTIDNDVPGTQRTYGADTAVAETALMLKSLADDAMTQDLISLYVVSIMGRMSGSWALEAGLAAKSNIILIPEMFSVKGLREILSLTNADFPKKDDLIARISNVLKVNGKLLSFSRFARAIEGQSLTDADLKLCADLLATEVAKITLNNTYDGIRHGVVVVSEGLAGKLPTRPVTFNEKSEAIEFEVEGLLTKEELSDGKRIVICVDAHNNPRVADVKIEQPLADLIRRETKKLGIPAKVVAQSAGYQFRSLRPKASDVRLAMNMGAMAANLLLQGKSGRMVVVNGYDELGSVDYRDLPYADGHLIPRVVDLSKATFINAMGIGGFC